MLVDAAASLQRVHRIVRDGAIGRLTPRRSTLLAHLPLMDVHLPV
jgi:hypothetical protein